MNTYVLWGKRKDANEYEKIEEFDEKEHIFFMLDVIIRTGDYSEALVLQNGQYVCGKKAPRDKVKMKNVYSRN